MELRKAPLYLDGRNSARAVTLKQRTFEPQ